MKKRSGERCDKTEEEEERREMGVEEEESGYVREKKRRLSVEQVKALEKHFEVENKLEPERKTKLAEELGLQPRQVAVWFQNRRARWKSKQLEKDFSILKSSFDSLHQHFVSLQQENDSLKHKIRALNEEEEDKMEMEMKMEMEEEEATTKVEAAGEVASVVNEAMTTMMGSESDSSAVLNSPNSTSNNDDVSLMISQQAMMISYFNLSEGSVKMEEHEFLGEEGCNFFPEDQAPTLHWYCNPDDDHYWTT